MSNEIEEKYWRVISNSSKTTSARERKLNKGWKHFWKWKIGMVWICSFGCWWHCSSQKLFRMISYWQSAWILLKESQPKKWNQSREIEITRKDVRYAKKGRTKKEVMGRGRRRRKEREGGSHDERASIGIKCTAKTIRYLWMTVDTFAKGKFEEIMNASDKNIRLASLLSQLTVEYENCWCASSFFFLEKKKRFFSFILCWNVFVRWRTNQSTI